MAIIPNEKIDGEKIKVKISTNLSLIILASVLFLALGVIVVTQYINNRMVSEGLKGVYITDVNDRSATISWVTSNPVKTELLYSTKEIKSFLSFLNSDVGYDKRDLEEVGELEYKLKQRGKYYVHSVHLRDLSPETNYYFAIRNGLFLASSEYVNFFSTITEREQVNTPDVAYGNVLNQEGELISDTLLIFELSNLDDSYKSQRFSYVMDGKTGWSVNMSNLMNTDLNEEYTKEQETYLNVLVINATGESSKAFHYDEVKPAENISAYDNSSVTNSQQRDVKGIMAVLIPGVDQPPAQIDGCPCYSCTVSCPSDYPLTSCPSDWNCANKSFSCTKFYRCTDGESGPCGTNSRVCYKKTTPKVVEKEPDPEVCKDCVPTCPAGGFSFKPCTGKGECETKPATCIKRNQDGDACGSRRGALCYKETIVEEKEENPVTRETCGYNPDEKLQYFWCECTNYPGAKSACLSSEVLANEPYNSSCPKYCNISAQGGFIKEKICGQGELRTCLYGCESKGPKENDICKPEPIGIPQETSCFKLVTEARCLAGSSCQWESNKCIPLPMGGSCSSYKNIYTCNQQGHCEYVSGKCQEINLEGYIKTDAAQGVDDAYCTGMKDSNGKYIGINYGTNSIDTHDNASRCSIDIRAYEVNLGNQIPGSVLRADGTREWVNGFSCRVGPYQEKGYGNHIIVTTPEGLEVIYAHLSYANCNGRIQTGNTGNTTGAHLHLEVRDPDILLPESCGGEMNPCQYTPGGCFQCTSTKQVAVAVKNTRENPIVVDNSIIKMDFFNLVKKAHAQESGYLNPEELVKDLQLQDGTYNVKVGSTSKKTAFVKTENSQIVFFEDDNDNGLLDAGETVLSPYESKIQYEVSYERVADSYQLVLEEGLNLVSFPIVFKDAEEKDIQKVSELIEFLNTKGTEISSIATYRGGKFIAYVLRDGTAFGDDFNVLPGEGYFVNAHARGVFNYSGLKIKEGLEISLYPGWNLVNIYNSKVEKYSGFEILNQIKEQSIDADTISKWEDGAYSSIVSEEGNQYGNDYNIYQNRGYFVRVDGERGSFTPK